MLKIDIEIDLPGFEKEVDDHMAEAFAPAVVEAGVDAVRRGIIMVFDRPDRFILTGMDVLKTSIKMDSGDSSVLLHPEPDGVRSRLTRHRRRPANGRPVRKGAPHHSGATCPAGLL